MASCRMPGLPCAPCPMRVRYVGMPKLGPTLCAQEVDEPSCTDKVRRVRHRTANPNTHKMSVGVLQSLYASNDKALFFDDTEMNGQRYAMCLKAFAFLHIRPVYEWTRKMLDHLMQEGAELYSLGPMETSRKSGDLASEREQTASLSRNVYNINEQGIRRAFKLENYEFEVELGKKFSPEQEENATENASTDIHVVGLKPALHEFFKKRKFCLLSTFNLYLFIWNEDGVYFVLDFYGRTPELSLQREGGHATLVCMREVRSVDYLITQKSFLSKKDTFVLREMRLVMLVDPEGRALMSYYDASRADEFVRVSTDYAYLKSKLHLSLREKNPLLSRCGLPVAIAAIITSKIDHPASWDSKNLNKIICYGFFICQCCWEYCQNSQVPIDYDSFPNQLQIGQFSVNLSILPKIEQGVWRCVPRSQATDLSTSIVRCFDTGQHYLLLTVNQQTYAIFRKHGFYYIFDPYRHRLPNEESRSASLRMFSSLDTFLKVLNLILLQSNTKSRFFIHRVVVTNIRVSIGVESLPPAPSPEDLIEVKSINEGICFREDYKRCWDDLGQISDDEDEDSLIEEVMEESEKEPPVGEEEGEYDYEDVEWSDGAGGRRRRRGRRGRGKFGFHGGKWRGGGGKGGGGRWGKGKGGGKGGGGKGGGGKGGKGRRGRGTDGFDGDGKGGKGKGKGKGRGRKSRPSGSYSSISIGGTRHHKSRLKPTGSYSSISIGGTRHHRSRSKSRSRGSRSRDSRSRRSRSRGSRKGSRSRGSRRSRESKGSRSGRSRSKRRDGDDYSSSSSGSRDGSRSRRRKRGSSDRRGSGDSDRDRDRSRDRARRDEKGRAGGDKGDGKWDDDSEDGEGRGRRGERGERGEKDERGERGDGEKYGPNGEFGGKGDGGIDGHGYGEGGRYGEDGSFYRDKYGEKRSKDDSGLSTAGYGEFGYKDDDSADKREGTVCRPNSYPGYRAVPYNLAVAGSETGTFESICKLLRAGFKYADRVLTMTPYGNFVVFRGCSMLKKTYFVFDGCTCNVERFRHLDLNCGTAGLICFNSLHYVVTYIIDTRLIRKCLRRNRTQMVEEICSRYCK